MVAFSENQISSERQKLNGAYPKVVPALSKNGICILENSQSSDCEKLYGPYPRAIPVPTVDKNGETAPEAVVGKAKTIWDLQSTPDYRDVGTPDEWLPRDGRLVRLTGRHPFNCEPPLNVLNETRFITPTSLHYVRNHGACPKLCWEEHRIKV